MRLPLRPTLFPYTTLFRSSRVPGDGGAPLRPPRARGIHRRAPLAGARGPGRPRAAVDADRKSTRLNSSHLGISYAVFCLKKKNRPEQATARPRTHTVGIDH